MLEKSNEYKKKTIHWAIAIVTVSSILLVLLGFILSPKIEFGKKVITVNLFSTEMPVYSSIIILSMICLIIYVIRIFIKIMMSSKHLSEEYRQKYVLTYFYLSLVAMILGTQLFLTGFVGELVARNSSERNNYQIEKEI